ncbi:MAG: hypothetical protein KDD47_26040, partial [Acidobacteria bacterium]|nr:hypothetical protein [Acidobacteriota bacterium]
MRDRARLEPPFKGLEPPSPPPDLRRKALASAYQAMEEMKDDVWTRLWNARPLRLAWLCATALLLLGHLSASRLIRGSGKPGAPFAASSSLPSQELAEVMDLPPIRLDARAFFGSAAPTA